MTEAGQTGRAPHTANSWDADYALRRLFPTAVGPFSENINPIMKWPIDGRPNPSLPIDECVLKLQREGIFFEKTPPGIAIYLARKEAVFACLGSDLAVRLENERTEARRELEIKRKHFEDAKAALQEGLRYGLGFLFATKPARRERPDYNARNAVQTKLGTTHRQLDIALENIDVMIKLITDEIDHIGPPPKAAYDEWLSTFIECLGYAYTEFSLGRRRPSASSPRFMEFCQDTYNSLNPAYSDDDVADVDDPVIKEARVRQVVSWMKARPETERFDRYWRNYPAQGERTIDLAEVIASHRRRPSAIEQLLIDAGCSQIRVPDRPLISGTTISRSFIESLLSPQPTAGALSPDASSPKPTADRARHPKRARQAK